jgi:hypothetical protein
MNGKTHSQTSRSLALSLRAQRVIVAVATLSCALWVAVAPVVAQFHQAFASHWHVYDARTQRVLDVVRRPNTIPFWKHRSVNSLSRDADDDSTGAGTQGVPARTRIFTCSSRVKRGQRLTLA